jgi:hypothetical protein
VITENSHEKFNKENNLCCCCFSCFVVVVVKKICIDMCALLYFICIKNYKMTLYKSLRLKLKKSKIIIAKLNKKYVSCYAQENRIKKSKK